LASAFFTPETSMSAAVECIWAARAVLGEGPVWDRRHGRVVWIDIKGARLHAIGLADGARMTWTPPVRMCSLDVPGPGWRQPPDLCGNAYVGCGDEGLCWIGLVDGGDPVDVRPIVHPERHLPANRFNDGKFGPDGCYWAGTLHNPEEEDTGSLYRFHADGRFDTVDSGYRVPNGPAFSPDGSRIYHTDSARREVYVLHLDAGGGKARRELLIRFGEADGYPDGMTVDNEGNLWIAMWDGASIQKVSPDGRRLSAVAIPARRPTSCAFVAADASELVVTSASIGLDGSDELAGGLFRVRLSGA
jgi:sugar lactone lactonase YvrE